MRLRWVALGLAVTVAGLGLVACGDDSASSSSPESLTVTASEPSEGKYAFDLPDEVKGGTVTLTLKNTGAEPHELGLVRVADGTTRSSSPTTCSRQKVHRSPSTCSARPAGWAGSPRALTARRRSASRRAPTCTSARSVTLPHYQNGMLGEFTVTDVASTAALPDNAAEVDASEYKFDVNGLKAGDNTSRSPTRASSSITSSRSRWSTAPRSTMSPRSSLGQPERRRPRRLRQGAGRRGHSAPARRRASR